MRACLIRTGYGMPHLCPYHQGRFWFSRFVHTRKWRFRKRSSEWDFWKPRLIIRGTVVFEYNDVIHHKRMPFKRCFHICIVLRFTDNRGTLIGATISLENLREKGQERGRGRGRGAFRVPFWPVNLLPEIIFDSLSLGKFQRQNHSHVLQTNVCFAGSICVSECLPAGAQAAICSFYKVRRMWRWTFVPETIFRGFFCLKQTDGTCWTIQTHANELNWDRRWTFHKLSSRSLVHFMKCSALGAGLTRSILRLQTDRTAKDRPPGQTLIFTCHELN